MACCVFMNHWVSVNTQALALAQHLAAGGLLSAIGHGVLVIVLVIFFIGLAIGLTIGFFLGRATGGR